MQQLLKYGADVNAVGSDHSTTLYAASERGRQEIVRLLLINGANVNAQGGLYGHPVYAAFEKGHLEIRKILLQHGADISLEEYHGLVPID